LIEQEPYFDRARDLTIAALLASTQLNASLPAEFPKEAHKQLAAVGRRLGEDEGMNVRNGVGPGATVTKLSRRRLATMVNMPLEVEETLDGEVEALDDNGSRFVLRRKGEKFDVSFARTQRQLLTDALRGRPILGVHIRGTVLVGAKAGRKVTQVGELDVFEHPRAGEVRKMWNRIDHLSTLEDGWIEGEGSAPSETAIVRAREILARLLVDHEWVARPKVYPTPDGGVQAEWTLGRWACEVAFSADGTARGEATEVEDDRDSEIELDTLSASNADQLASWLMRLAGEHGDVARV
jgi:hypothetical protein